ncbi:YtcA family lipoprotein [Devosia sp. 2618]|uniref:YtcA family lipoprotein n=1 Tax=Devosia sp. 2618 TaxID=3156454 RepID=UPI0033992A2F
MIRLFLAVVAALCSVGCTGTARAPSVPVFGSFFPAWIICAVGGVVVTLIVRALLIRLRLDEHLPAPPLVYLCLTIGCGILGWLVWSGVIG